MNSVDTVPQVVTEVRELPPYGPELAEYNATHGCFQRPVQMDLAEFDAKWSGSFVVGRKRRVSRGCGK